MQVLKIVAEGPVTSFRYPHFMLSAHPTYEMPPPATIYGHICSALGNVISPEGVAFAYRFTYKAKVTDLEHIHVLAPSTGKLKNTGHPKVLEGNVNPYERELLFEPKLTLYINKPEWEKYFKSPCYPVVLGRSQDLFSYNSVNVVHLEKKNHAYLEGTLAPYAMLRKIGKGVAILMPRYLDYAQNREPVFSRYLMVRKRILSNDFIQSVPEFWVDPDSPEYEGSNLGLFFHNFTGDGDETIKLT